MIINPYVFGGGGGGVDPNFANVASLLPFDGANLSTAFNDVIPGRVWTRNGTPIISTAQSPYGAGSSGLFSGATDEIVCGPDAGLSAGSGDYTFEGWVYPTASMSGTNQCIFDNRSAVNNGLAIYAHVASLGYWCTADNATAYSSNASLMIGAWNYLSVGRFGGTVFLHSGGVYRGGYTDARTYAATPTSHYGKDYTGGAGLQGIYLCDWRITLGVCRNPSTSSYTIPSGPHPHS